MGKMAVEYSKRLEENQHELHQELKSADELICTLCKRLNPQHAAMDDYKGCQSCEEREPRKQLLIKLEVL